MRTKEDIIRYARELRCEYNTRDPYILARHYGIRVGDDLKLGISKKAYTIKMDNYPTTIMINNVYDMRSKIVLCAHELGHALLHDSGISNFAITEKNAFDFQQLVAHFRPPLSHSWCALRAWSFCRCPMCRAASGRGHL